MSLHEAEDDSLKTFGAADYAVFAFMLALCSGVGLYFGYKDHTSKKNSRPKEGSEANNFLLGGQNVQIFPVAMSLVSTFATGVTILGTSTEIYIYGMQYAYVLASPVIMGVFMHFIIIPVFYDLKVVSIFEYLERRFDMKMRLLGSLISSVSAITWFPLVIYVPALAFNQTTGIGIHFITPIVMAVSVFLTCLGGIKSVVWTGVIQVATMSGVILLIIVKGTIDVGGLGVVIERNWESGRIEAPDLRIDPTIRHSFWTLFVGGSCFWIIVNSSQNAIQRFLALKDLKSVRNGLILYIFVITLLIIMCIYNGLLLYATFYDCDPLTTKLAKAKDQLMPLLVMKLLKDSPGLPGLFIAAIFSAALSAISAGLNSMSALVLEDYFKPLFKDRISERGSGYIMRGTVIFLGALSVGLVYVVEHLGSVLQLSMSVPATCVSSLFGIFSIGLFLPWIGKRATFYGALIASTIMIYVVVRAQLDMANGLIVFDKKITSVEGCNYNFTKSPDLESQGSNEEASKEIHHISYLYYMPLGALITCMSAFILSFLFGFEDPSSVDPRLLAPFMRRYFETRVFDTSKRDDETEEIVVKFEMKDNKL